MSQTLRFHPGGHIDCLYTEAIDLRALGRLHVFRATDIRFCERTQLWKVRCATTGKLLHCDPSREACLVWEHANLQPSSEVPLERAPAPPDGSSDFQTLDLQTSDAPPIIHNS